MRFRLLAAIALLVFSSILNAKAVDKPYTIDVWADVQFNTEGSVQNIVIIDETTYPAAFSAGVKARLAALQIKPPVLNGKVGEMQSGVRMIYQISPATTETAAKASVLSIDLMPIPTRKYYAPFPTVITRNTSWGSKVFVRCVINVKGRCVNPEISSTDGSAPEAARKFAQDTIQKWTFKSQTVDGMPIEGEFKIAFSLSGD